MGKNGFALLKGKARKRAENALKALRNKEIGDLFGCELNDRVISEITGLKVFLDEEGNETQVLLTGKIRKKPESMSNDSLNDGALLEVKTNSRTFFTGLNTVNCKKPKVKSEDMKPCFYYKRRIPIIPQPQSQ